MYICHFFLVVIDYYLPSSIDAQTCSKKINVSIRLCFYFNKLQYCVEIYINTALRSTIILRPKSRGSGDVIIDA